MAYSVLRDRFSVLMAFQRHSDESLSSNAERFTNSGRGI